MRRNETLRLIRGRLSLALDRFEAGQDKEAERLLNEAAILILSAEPFLATISGDRS